MKVIGYTEKGYMLDATKEEIANLIGFYSTYGEEFRKKSIGIGSEINVSGMYKQLYGLAGKYDDIERAKDNLKRCIELLDIVNPLIDVSIKPNDFADKTGISFNNFKEKEIKNYVILVIYYFICCRNYFIQSI